MLKLDYDIQEGNKKTGVSEIMPEHSDLASLHSYTAKPTYTLYWFYVPLPLTPFVPTLGPFCTAFEVRKIDVVNYIPFREGDHVSQPQRQPENELILWA